MIVDEKTKVKQAQTRLQALRKFYQYQQKLKIANPIIRKEMAIQQALIVKKGKYFRSKIAYFKANVSGRFKMKNKINKRHCPDWLQSAYEKI